MFLLSDDIILSLFTFPIFVLSPITLSTLEPSNSIFRESSPGAEVFTTTSIFAGSVQTGENGQKSELVQVEAEKNNQAAEYQAIFQLDVPNAKLWDTEHPNLYTCKAVFGEDEVIETFGIRELIWNPQVGMTINGERVILRGACFHHDNGVLGACTYPEAEERKMRILKENGYNAVRSAHYPCSKALLDACDRM